MNNMKKLLCIFLSTIMLLSLCSCTQASAASVEWLEETQEMIKRDYARFENETSLGEHNFTADDVIINHYFGTYQNGALALSIKLKSVLEPFIICDDEIADISFSYSGYNPLFIYYKNMFTPLKEAYENGTVSKEDVAEILKLYKFGMDRDMYDKICKDYSIYREGDIKAEEVEFECYGIYQNNAAAILILSVDSLAKIVEEDIAGIHFTFNSTEPIRIYKDGAFTPLKKAYEEGIISKEEVFFIHERSKHYEEYFGE